MREMNIPYIKGVTFGFMAPRGKFADEKAKDSMRKLKECTAANTVILAIAAQQKTAHSEEIDFTGPHMPTDDEVKEMIILARSLELKVILKPMVNCTDGTWRAHINFFDKEVPCEPKWRNWFKSYTAFQLHYGKLAEEMGCEMLIIGCEMVQTQRRSDEWRQLIQEVRGVYHGLISYNTDKYQEEEVSWWDVVDVISSSGYYPIDDWDNQLERIYEVVKKYKKPFFFAEAGCMSSKGSSLVPNNWELAGELDLQEQREYYEMMFQKCSDQDWVRGFGVWDWDAQLYKEEDGKKELYYAIYGKPACQIVKSFYNKNLL